jgi:hypothetical protein
MPHQNFSRTIGAALALALASCSPAPPSGPVEFTPPRLAVGDAVLTTVTSTFKGGTFQASSTEASASGSISIERNRTVKKTVIAADDTGPLRCSIDVPEDTVKMTLFSGGQNSIDTIEGPLVGRPIEATRNGDTWSITLVDEVPDADQADALLGIQSFENRAWFPDHPVALGESWDYDPAYFRVLLERDLGGAAATGRMTLRSLERHPDGSAQARLDLVITSSGLESTDDDLERQANIEARGSLIVNLDTMLDREMIIEGLLRSGVSNDSSSATLELPIRIEVRREIIKK